MQTVLVLVLVLLALLLVLLEGRLPSVAQGLQPGEPACLLQDQASSRLEMQEVLHRTVASRHGGGSYPQTGNAFCDHNTPALAPLG